MLKRIEYVLRCAMQMDYIGLFNSVNKIHRESKKSRLWLLLDMFRCGFRYGAGFNDYLLCEFYNLTDAQRATYVTRGINNTLISLLNDREYYHFFDNKSEFYTKFAPFLGRRWLDFSKADLKDFKAFIKGRETIMVKPEAESGGKGVEKLSKTDFASEEEFYQKLKKDKIGVVEEVIVQHPALASLNPDSVNTVRVVTILNGEGPHIVYAHIRIGNSGRPVDNLHSGGMFAPIDLTAGRIQYPAYDKTRVTYIHHPRTNIEIQGFQLPFWKETLQMCLEAAEIVPQMRYIGWDVAITEAGPIFVEGNNLPGYDILQMPPHVPDKVGMLPRFREFVKGI